MDEKNELNVMIDTSCANTFTDFQLGVRVPTYLWYDTQYFRALRETAPDGAKTVMRSDSGRLVADICKDGKVTNTNTLMPDIIDVSVIESDGIKKVVIVKFADDTIQKAVLSNGDFYSASLEQGISICVTKKLLDMKAGHGSSLYNKIVNRGVKIYNKSQKEKERKAKEAAEQKARAEKAAEKKRRKKQKREAAIRENQIEIQKEAYLRAMRERNGLM